MTCFSLIAAISAKTGLKPGVKLNPGANSSHNYGGSQQTTLLKSSYFLVLSIIRRGYIKLLSDFGPEIQFHKHVFLVFAKLVVQTTIFLLFFFHEQHAVREHQMIHTYIHNIF